jgi:hypothetical protein
MPDMHVACKCFDEHMWFTIGVVRHEDIIVHDGEFLDPTTFGDPMGRFCPLCGQPDQWALRNDMTLEAVDPGIIHIPYVVVTDDGGTVYVDHRLMDAP